MGYSREYGDGARGARGEVAGGGNGCKPSTENAGRVVPLLKSRGIIFVSLERVIEVRSYDVKRQKHTDAHTLGVLHFPRHRRACHDGPDHRHTGTAPQEGPRVTRHQTGRGIHATWQNSHRQSPSVRCSDRNLLRCGIISCTCWSSSLE